MAELRPPVDFNPPIPRAEPTLAELVEVWEERERVRRERERARLWAAARDAARAGAMTAMDARGIDAPAWLHDSGAVGPRARAALPAAATGAHLVARAGVDTWSPSWYVPEDSGAGHALRELVPAAGYFGRPLQGDADGHRVIWFPDAALLAAEGHPSPGRLARAEELPEAHERVRLAVSELVGAEVREAWNAGVRRLDATCDLAHDVPAEGLALLSGVAALYVGGVQSVVRRAASSRRIETVEMHGHRGRRILARVYDKGVERGDAVPGALVRLEDQRRYDRAARRDVCELTTAYVRGAFKRRFVPLWRASKGVKVAGPLVLAARIGELVESGELTPTKARAVAGFLLLDAAGVRQGGRTTCWRLQRACAEAGLVLPDGVMQEVEVDLGEVLEAVLEADAWTERN
ncbi:MAG: hypothetical protein ACJ76L_03160 [Conexibacter sp.]